MKDQEKSTENLSIDTAVLTENIITVYNDPSKVNETLHNCNLIRKYTNKELKKLSILYNQKVELLDSDWWWHGAKYTKKRLKGEVKGTTEVFCA